MRKIFGNYVAQLLKSRCGQGDEMSQGVPKDDDHDNNPSRHHLFVLLCALCADSSKVSNETCFKHPDTTSPHFASVASKIWSCFWLAESNVEPIGDSVVRLGLFQDISRRPKSMGANVSGR